MGRILSAFLMLGISSMCGAQIYKYLGIEDGLSNRRIYRIQKDGRGYMWFLTQEGMDRYDGKRIRHYTVLDGNLKVAPQVNLNWLYTDTENTLWVVGRKGRIFHYDTLHDRFRMVYRILGLQDDFATGMLCYAYMDRGDRIWLCQGDHIIRYDTRTGIAQRLVSRLRGDITAISETDGTNLFIGTVNGLFPVRERDGVLEALADTDSIRTPVSELYYHPGSKKLFVGTFRKGILVYGVSAGSTLRNVAVNRITPLNDRELLIATGGRGVYRMDMDSLVPKPYITADYASHNGMNGDNINDIYVDGGDRIWLANYPAGVTIRNNRYQSYEWFRHSPGNSRSLVNDQVHDVIEDSEGDLWFATSNGISLLQPAVGRWRSFLSRSDGIQDGGNHIFLTLCEVSPGVICAGGYASGLYRIEKKTGRVEYFPPSFAAEGRPDQYINDIGKDSGGCIWTGGCHNLKRFDPHDGTVRLYPVPGPITAILEKAPEWMWIGTGMGLYLLDGHGGTCRHIAFPVEAVHVYALYQAPDGLLYIGTGGAGLLVYDSVEDRFVRQYQTENCALISNNIHTIVPRADGTLLLGTENSVALFRRESGTFRNWTAEQGLASVCLNAGVSTFRHGESFVFGSNTGAVMFPSDMRIPAPHFSRMLLRDFMISYRPVYPGDKGSPLREDIDNTVRLELAYDQNTFSLEAVSINYDYPSNILYSWKLEGLYEGWSHPVQSGRIQFTSLPPGNYTLRIRAVSNEEKYKVYEERSLGLSVARPLWAGTWAIAGYASLCVLAGVVSFRVAMLRRQKRISDEKTCFFIHTAHDVRTPLTLIKAPLEEVVEKDMVKAEGMDNVRMALKSVDGLLGLVTSLIDFESTDNYTLRLHVSEYELNSYLETTCEAFRTYASIRDIDITRESGFPYLNVRFDKDKMDSILKNILSNALKYTPRGGSIQVRAFADRHVWGVEVEDTGIGIPPEERKKLFRNHFRGSNAVNLQVAGNGVGLMMVHRLVRLHGGRVRVTSTEGKGTMVCVIFPLRSRRLDKACPVASPRKQDTGKTRMGPDCGPMREILPTMTGGDRQRILIVEDNDDLRTYLEGLLKEEYLVQTCSNGRDALLVTREYNPDLILSDVMMPEMGGDELCASVKSDIETSHIPVMLLTALGDEKDMLEGLENGADAYITKPFSINVLRTNIRNILANRALLKRAYAGLEDGVGQVPPDCHNTRDWKFMASVRECVMKNIDNPGFCVDMLCGMQNMSRTGFFNKLKALTGHAPADYIRSMRLQYAAQLLREKDCSITEISDDSGFSDVRYFREVFRKYYGMSPSEYRNSMRG